MAAKREQRIKRGEEEGQRRKTGQVVIERGEKKKKRKRKAKR